MNTRTQIIHSVGLGGYRKLILRVKTNGYKSYHERDAQRYNDFLQSQVHQMLNIKEKQCFINGGHNIALSCKLENPRDNSHFSSKPVTNLFIIMTN
jgi:hypothetical protein